MSRARQLVVAGVIRAGRRRDALPAGTRQPVEGVNLLDTPLGVAGSARPAPLMSGDGWEPDLSARYRLPSSPAEPVDQVHAGHALERAIAGLDLNHDTFRLLTWADSWPAADRSALATLIEAARTTGGGSR